MEAVSFIHMASSAGLSACVAEILTLPIGAVQNRRFLNQFRFVSEF